MCTYLKTTISHFMVRARHAAKMPMLKVCDTRERDSIHNVSAGAEQGS